MKHKPLSIYRISPLCQDVASSLYQTLPLIPAPIPKATAVFNYLNHNLLMPIPELPINGIIQYLLFGIRTCSLSMFLRFLPVVSSTSRAVYCLSLFIAELYSTACIYHRCLLIDTWAVSSCLF